MEESLGVSFGSYETLLLFSSIFMGFSALVVVAQNTWKLGASAWWMTFAVVYGGCYGTGYLWGLHLETLNFASAASILMLVIFASLFRAFNVAGLLLLVASVQFFLFATAWAIHFLISLNVPNTVFYVLGAMFILSLPLLPLGLSKLWILVALLGRRDWKRPRAPLNGTARDFRPKVSIHVPCYAEPPEVVIRTLDALALLDYPEYEVLVIDNNTPDPKLWLPLQRHCEMLGERFRFFHVDKLEGAKAGALNYLAPHTAKDAQIIACVDSDYVAEPDFLSRLTGFFADEKIGFVQTSHDYREWGDTFYLESCYWEYMPTYKQLLPTLNEWSSAYTVGTMCLIRRKALDDAGGWAEWCLTEDSEIAIRIHDLGYKSIALADTFGRGLIPETFTDYKKQRFRWTAGPAQQLKRHYRTLLSNILSRDCTMSPSQKIFELMHCTEGFQFVGSFMAWLLTPVLLMLLIGLGISITLPHFLFYVLAVGTVSALVIRFLEYRMIGASIRQTLMAQLASMALLHTREVASIAGLFSRKPLAWTRTNKFKALPSGMTALKSTGWETLRGLLSISVAAIAFTQISFDAPSIELLVTVMLMLSGLSYLSAPVMASLGEMALAQESSAGKKSLVVKDRPVLAKQPVAVELQRAEAQFQQ